MGSCFRLVCFSLLFVFVLAWAGWLSLASCFFFFGLEFFFFWLGGFFFWAVELDLIAEATREGGRGCTAAKRGEPFGSRPVSPPLCGMLCASVRVLVSD